jgi:hypothetical protein
MPIMAAVIKRYDNAVAAMLGKIAVLFQLSFDQLLDDEVEVDG